MRSAWAPSRDQLRKPAFDSTVTIRLPLPATATSGPPSRESAVLHARPRNSVITPSSSSPRAATTAPSADMATNPRPSLRAGLDPAHELSLLGEEVDPAAPLRRHDHVVFRAGRRDAETVVLESDRFGERLAVQGPQRDAVAIHVGDLASARQGCEAVHTGIAERGGGERFQADQNRRRHAVHNQGVAALDEFNLAARKIEAVFGAGRRQATASGIEDGGHHGTGSPADREPVAARRPGELEFSTDVPLARRQVAV